MEVICINCRRAISRQFLDNHQKGKKCAGDAIAGEMLRQGLVPFPWGHDLPAHLATIKAETRAPYHRAWLDDMFSEYQSVNQINDYSDIPAIMAWVASIYERRTLVLCTSNFPLMTGIARAVHSVDKIGRTMSRLNELLANSGEIELPGRDYRATVADKRNKDDLFKA